MKGWAWLRVSIRVSHPAAPGSILIASQICLNVAEIYRRHYLECKQLTDVALVLCLNYKKSSEHKPLKVPNVDFDFDVCVQMSKT